MRQSVDINAFTSGEITPRLKGRGDTAQYAIAAETMRNFVVMPQGGVTRRPGTLFAALVGNQSYKVRLIEFIFSTVQSYVLELGELYARFYMNDAQIVSGSPVQLTTPWHASETAAIGFTQSADTLYLCHGSYQQRTITRSSHTSWSIQTLTALDGPYLPQGIAGVVMTFGGTTGSISVSISATTGVNGGAGFKATDVGRAIRVKIVALWAWLRITAWTDSTHVTATVQGNVNIGAIGFLDGAPWTANTYFPVAAIVTNGGQAYQVVQAGYSNSSGGPTGTGTSIADNSVIWKSIPAPPNTTANFRLGKWSDTTGWPSYAMFWQNRLVFAGTNDQPGAIEASVSGDFTNFAESNSDGTVVASNALSWVISSDQVDAIRWLKGAGSSQSMQLGIGTSGGENIMQPATNTQALSPSNVQVYPETNSGAVANVRALRIGKSVLFWNRSGRKLIDWIFQWAANGYVGQDRTVFAEHVSRGGIAWQAYQAQPHSVLWCGRNDGALIGLTYLPEQNVVAWHQHQLGGNYYGGIPIVESGCCKPSTDGTYDELWLSVLRTINGTPTRTVEVMMPYFDAQPVEQAFYVDCGLSNGATSPAATMTLSGLANIALKGQPPSFGGAGIATASAGVFDASSVGRILRGNGGAALVTGYTDATHVTFSTIAPFTGLAPALANAWSLTAPLSSFSGLGHLVGEPVSVLGDGVTYGNQTVAGGGTITLTPPASLVTAGLGYASVGLTLPFVPAHAAASGRVKEIDNIYLRLHESVGGYHGTRMQDEYTNALRDGVTPIQSRYSGSQMGVAAPLFSGILPLNPMSDYDREARVLFGQDDPLPFTVLALGITGDVTDQQP